MGCGKSKTTPQTEDAPLLKTHSPEPKQPQEDSSPEKTTSGYSKLPQTDESIEEPAAQQGGGNEDASKEAKLDEVVEEVEE